MTVVARGQPAASDAPDARWLLDQLAVHAAWQAVDLGCRPLGILGLLAERVGVEGRVLGIEREPRFVDTARTLIAERKLAPAEILQADATATGLPDTAFDLVHARLVLLHQREPDRLIAEMLRLARVGSRVALQEIDVLSFVCEPPHPAWTRLWDAQLAVSTDLDIDVHVGRRLPGVLRRAGLAEVQTEAHTRLWRRASRPSMTQRWLNGRTSRGREGWVSKPPAEAAAAGWAATRVY